MDCNCEVVKKEIVRVSKLSIGSAFRMPRCSELLAFISEFIDLSLTKLGG